MFTTQKHIKEHYKFFTKIHQKAYGNTYFAKEGCNEIKDTKACFSGQNNTKLLSNLSNFDQEELHQAALACFCLGEKHDNSPDKDVADVCLNDPANTNSLNGHGHDDWYLPSVKELEYVYNEISPLTDTLIAQSFSNSHYWSSSVITSRRAWKIFFGNGDITSYDNKMSINVRCLRSD